MTRLLSVLLLFFFITYDCLRSVIHSQAELTARGAFHAVFAIAVLILLGLKISFIEIYRQFFGKVMTIGPVIALISLGMIGTLPVKFEAKSWRA